MPKIDRLILSGGPGERRIALLQGDEIVDFEIDRFTVAAGDILLGRVLPRPQGLTAAFIEIGEAQPGFLGHPGKLTEGERVIVQVTAAARRDKGATLSSRPSLPGRFLAYDRQHRGVTLSRQIADPDDRARLTAALQALLLPDESVIARSAAPLADREDLTADLERLRAQWAALERQAAAAEPPARLIAPGALGKLLAGCPDIASIEIDDPALLPEARRLRADARLVRNIWSDSGAADLFEQCLDRSVPLAGGGKLTIDETEALTVIDIDGGGQSHKDANHAALPEIARQIRLRGLAGHLLIDIIPSSNRGERDALVEKLRGLFADDPTPTQVIGATRLGLLELTRERRKPSLSELFLTPATPRRTAESIALEGLKAVLTAALHQPSARLQLVAAPAAIGYLGRRPDLLAEISARLGRPLTMTAREGLDGFEVCENAS